LTTGPDVSGIAAGDLKARLTTALAGRYRIER
jgi:hypothetical protein